MKNEEVYRIEDLLPKDRAKNIESHKKQNIKER